MITEALLDFFFASVDGLIGLFPDLGERPDWIASIYAYVATVNKLIGWELYLDFFPYMLGAFALLLLLRVVRYFLPGG